MRRAITILVLLIMINNSAFAEDCTKAINALNLCNQYVKALSKDNGLLHQKINVLEDSNKKLSDELVKTEESGGLTTVTWLIIGIVAGSVVTYTISKH